MPPTSPPMTSTCALWGRSQTLTAFSDLAVHAGWSTCMAAESPGPCPVLVVDPSRDLAARSVAEVAASIRESLATIQPTRIVLVSSLEASGPRPWTDTPVFEDDEPRPASDLGRALLELEGMLEAATSHVDAVVLRMGHLYGYGDPGCLTPILDRIRRADVAWFAKHGADRTIHPLHLRDAARAIVLSLAAPAGTYHVTCGPNPSTREVGQALVAALQERGQAEALRLPAAGGPAGDAVHFPYVHHRAVAAFGYEPAVDIWSGALRLVSELAVVSRGQDISSQLAFRDDGNTTEEEILESEARFWDEVRENLDLFYMDPHDWRFDIGLGNTLQAPVYRFVDRIMKKFGVKTVLDVGCGTGIYSLTMAEKRGTRVIGIDISHGEIDAARTSARERGIEHLARYEVANALEYAAPEKVDMVAAFGALHHLPRLQESIAGIIDRNLKPGGILLAAEPFHEGLSPSATRFLSWLGRSRFQRHFDIDRYHEHCMATERGDTLRTESPAGVEFHDEDFDLDAHLRSLGEVVDVRYLHMLAPLVANAGVIYMKRPRVRTLVRRLMGLIVRFDMFMCHFPQWGRWATQAMYAVRPRS